MVSFIIFTALAITSPEFQDLKALDEHIARVDASAQPLDIRLKLVRCPVDPVITASVGGVIAVRCDALGWRLRVPVRQHTQRRDAADLLVRKGELVECIDNGAGFSISTSMVALEDGAMGQAIRVKSPTSPSTMTATITARGVVRF